MQKMSKTCRQLSVEKNLHTLKDGHVVPTVNGNAWSLLHRFVNRAVTCCDGKNGCVCLPLDPYPALP